MIAGQPIPFQAHTKLRIPLASASVQAGFPSPAEDHMENSLDLNEHLVSNPAATFFVRVRGNSMRDAGIQGGDILVVDRVSSFTNLVHRLRRPNSRRPRQQEDFNDNAFSRRTARPQG